VARGLIQQLRETAPAGVPVRLYSPTPLAGELARLPAGWESRVLRWPLPTLWGQVRLALEMALRPPDVLLAPTHLLPLCSPRSVVCIVNDIGFSRTDALYGTSPSIRGAGSVPSRVLDLFLRAMTAGRYGASEQDYHRLMMRRALAATSQFVVCSEFTRQEMADEYSLPAASIAVVPWAVSPESFTSAASPAESLAVVRSYGIQQPYVLYVGRIEVKKNSRGLAAGFARLKEGWSLPHQLVLAGTPGNGYDEVRQVLRRAGVEQEVVETGWLPDEHAPMLLRHAAAFVFPSSYEGFGLPILDAQGAGIPLACSDIPVMREVAGTGAVYFAPDAPDEIAHALARVLTDQELRGQLVSAGRTNAQRFSWPRTGRMYWELLTRELAARPSPTPAAHSS
jgi:glycosyltransferase involved in cell wall biosynthesis